MKKPVNAKFLRERVKVRMDKIQGMMESNYHLLDPDEVMEVYWTVSKFWSILSDEDRDYLHAVRDACENETKWEV